MTSIAGIPIESIPSSLGPSPTLPLAEAQTRVSALSSILRKGHEANNGDVSLSDRVISKIFLLVNYTGLFRQALGIGQSSAEIHANHHNTSTAPTAFLGLPNSIGEAFCGIGNTFAAVTSTVPGAWKNLVKAYHANELFSKNESPLGKNEMGRALKIAIAQFINQIFYLCLGPTQTIHGTLSFIWDLHAVVQKIGEWVHSAAVNAWHLRAGLTGPLLHMIAKVSAVAGAAFYAIRGTCIIYRAHTSKTVVDKFQQDFKDAIGEGLSSEDKVDRLLKLMEEHESFADQLENDGGPKNLGGDYLNRRFSTEFLSQIEEGVIYTARGKLQSSGALIPYSSLTEKVAYLAAIDKGIYTEQLKHKLGMLIGAAMIVGAALTIAAAFVATGPAAPLVIGLVACMFFLCMEKAFYVYDNSEAFANWRDKNYKVSDWLKPLMKEARIEELGTGWVQKLIDEADKAEAEPEEVTRMTRLIDDFDSFMEYEVEFSNPSEQDVDGRMPEIA